MPNALGNLVKTLDRRYEGNRTPAFDAVIDGVQRNSSYQVTGVTASLQGAHGVPVQIGVNASGVAVGQVFHAENLGSLVAPIWSLRGSAVGGNVYAPRVVEFNEPVGAYGGGDLLLGIDTVNNANFVYTEASGALYGRIGSTIMLGILPSVPAIHVGNTTADHVYITNTSIALKSGAVDMMTLDGTNGIRQYTNSVQRTWIKQDGSGWFVATDKFFWDIDGNISLAGAVTARSGRIGGWAIGPDSLTSGGGSRAVGLDSGGVNPAFYAGSDTPSAAPLRLYGDGAIYAENATISGAIKTVTFEKSLVSATAGSQVIAKSAAMLSGDCVLSATTFAVPVMAQGGDEPFASGDLICIKAPGIETYAVVGSGVFEGAAISTLLPSGDMATFFNEFSGGTADSTFGPQCYCQLPGSDSILVGLSNDIAKTNGAIVVSIDPQGTLALEVALDEEGVCDMRVHDGKVYVVGADADGVGEDWSFGNVYIRSTSGVWTKKRTVPQSIHVFSQCWDSDGTWYVCQSSSSVPGGGGTYSGDVYKSTNDGDTWTRCTSVCSESVWNIAWFRDRLYVIANNSGGTKRIWTSTDRGTTWVDSTVTVGSYWKRWIIFNGELLAANSSTQLLVVGSDGTTATRNLPFTICNNVNWNPFSVSGDGSVLYLSGTTKVWQSLDGTNWTEKGQSTGNFAAFPWDGTKSLLSSTSGTSAALFKSGYVSPAGTWTYTATYKSGSSSGTVPVGSTIVDYGPDGGGRIFMTADQANAPYLDIATHNMATPPVWTGRLRIGNLAGITDAQTNPSGYGIWTDNGFFRGTLVSTTGLIGGWSLGATSLTSGAGANTVGLDSGGTNPAIYAGSATPSLASFKVAQDGTVTMTKAIITPITGSVIDGSYLSPGTVVASKLSVTAGGANLLLNSSFQTDTNSDGNPDGYAVITEGGSPTLTFPTGGADGRKFWRHSWVDWEIGGYTGFYTDSTISGGGVQGGWKNNQDYCLSFWAKSNVAATPSLVIESAPNILTTLQAPTISPTWQRFAYRFRWTSTGAQANGKFYLLFMTSAEFGTIDIDHVQVEQADTPSNWKPYPSELEPGSVIASHISVANLAAIKVDTGALNLSGFLTIGSGGGIYQGTGTAASPTTGLKVWNDTGAGRIAGYNTSVLQWGADTDGKLYAGAGAVMLDVDGITLASAVSGGAGSIKTKSGGVLIGEYHTGRDGSYNVSGGVEIFNYNSTASVTSSFGVYHSAGLSSRYVSASTPTTSVNTIIGSLLVLNIRTATGTVVSLRDNFSNEYWGLTNAGTIIGPAWKPATNSTTALQMQQADGTSVVNVDTTNRRVGIDTVAPTMVLSVSEKVGLTPDGGLAVLVVAGEALSRGNVVYVKVSGGADGKVWKTLYSDGEAIQMPTGFVYADAAANANVWIVTSGIAYALPETGVAAARGNVAIVSNAESGRLEQSSTVPTTEHWRECGHWLDTSSGNGVLARLLIHFN